MGKTIDPVRRLTDRQAAFAREYAIDFNATAAAARAGYSRKTAYSIGQENLTKPEVVAAIAKLTKPRMDELRIDADRVLQGLAELAFANILDFGRFTDDGGFAIDLSIMDRTSAGAIAAIKTRTYREGKGDDARTVTETVLKLADRRPALETLARHLRIIGGDQERTREPIRLILEHSPPAHLAPLADKQS